MEYKPEQYDDGKLLELLQGAFRDWKRMENICMEYDRIHVRQNGILYHVDLLKDTYLSLLKEARKRNLSLTSQELLSTILYTEPSEKRKQP